MVTLLLARFLPTFGYAPVIICPENGDFTAAARDEGAEVLTPTRGPSWRTYGRGRQGVREWLSSRHFSELIRYWFDLRAVLREHRIALLHCNDARAVIMAAPAGRLAGIPTLWHVHAGPLPGPYRWLDPMLALAAPNTVFVSEGMLEYRAIPKWMLGSRHVIHNGLGDVEPASPIVRNKSRPLIVIVGVLAPRKGQALLLSALPKVLARLSNMQCWLVGKDWSDGSYEGHLRQKSQDLGLTGCVEFLGQRRDVSSLMAASDCVVIPSISEPFGMVALEAMAQSKPVIATSTGGLRDIVAHDETGILVRAGDPDELANAIVRMLSDPKLARKMGEAGCRRAAEKFSATRMAEKFAALYDKILGSRNRSQDRRVP